MHDPEDRRRHRERQEGTFYPKWTGRSRRNGRHGLGQEDKKRKKEAAPRIRSQPEKVLRQRNQWSVAVAKHLVPSFTQHAVADGGRQDPGPCGGATLLLD